MLLDIILAGIVAVITWCVASDGAWGAALTFVSVLIAAVLATGCFETAAAFLEQNVSSAVDWQHRWDVISLIGLFSGFVFLFRLATERIMQIHVDLHGYVYDVARWVCGLGAGLVTMAFLLTALHTAPLPPGLMGFTPEPERRGGPLSRAAPDMKWLGFVHKMTEQAFRTGTDTTGTEGPVFDGPQVPLFPGGETKVLPSFPIRYASRNDRLYGGEPAANTGTPSAAPRPSGGGGTGRSNVPRF